MGYTIVKITQHEKIFKENSTTRTEQFYILVFIFYFCFYREDTKIVSQVVVKLVNFGIIMKRRIAYVCFFILKIDRKLYYDYYYKI